MGVEAVFEKAILKDSLKENINSFEEKVELCNFEEFISGMVEHVI